MTKLSEEMLSDLIKNVEKNLPKVTADVLRERLELVDSQEDRIKSLEKYIIELEDEHKRVVLELNELKNAEDFLNKAKTLNEETKRIKDEMWKQEMTNKLEAEREKTALVVGFTSSLMRNVDFRKEVFSNGGYYDQNNNYRNQNSNITETTKAE